VKPRKSERDGDIDLERFDVNVPLVAMVMGPNHYTALMWSRRTNWEEGATG